MSMGRRKQEKQEVLFVPSDQINSPGHPFFVRLNRALADHVIALGERHLAGVLRTFVRYHNEARPHCSLSGNNPLPRQTEMRGDITSTPVFGGLHHVYRRAA